MTKFDFDTLKSLVRACLITRGRLQTLTLTISFSSILAQNVSPHLNIFFLLKKNIGKGGNFVILL